MRVVKQESRNKLVRITLNNGAVIELPDLVDIKQTLNDFIVSEEPLNPKDYQVVLDGNVMRSFSDYSLVSFGGMIAKLPSEYEIEKRLNIGINFSP
jgi:hypothetical protein